MKKHGFKSRLKLLPVDSNHKKKNKRNTKEKQKKHKRNTKETGNISEI